MSTMSDLSEDLVEEILSRVPLTSLIAVRSTCKNWNAFSKNQILDKRATTCFLGFMLMDSRVCSMKFDLQGTHNDDDIAEVSINQVSGFDEVEITKVFHSHGLLLCLMEEYQNLVLWNPYLGHIRWIKPLNSFKNNETYGLGYDNNNGYHKILRFYRREHRLFCLEIYDFNANSWKVGNVTPGWDIVGSQPNMSLKGNTYFLALGFKDTEIEDTNELCLLSFDYTSERFGPLLPLPFHKSYIYGSESVTFSCVRDDQLALLFKRKDEIIEIWITTKIDPYSVSWSKFLEVDRRTLPWFPSAVLAGTFFIDEAEKKVVVVCNFHDITTSCCYQKAYAIGEDGYFISVVIKEARIRNKYGNYFPFVCSSYVPSLVKLKETENINN